MPCTYCHGECGQREFCDEFCYESYVQAKEELHLEEVTNPPVEEEPPW